MRAYLPTLLAEQPIVHPTRLVSISIEKRTLRVVLQGVKWWKNQFDQEGEISFIFDGFISGTLDLDIIRAAGDTEDDEVLEDFSVTQMKAGDWTDTPCYSIYGQAPLPNSMGLYMRLHDHLQRLQSYKTARDFLNCPPGKLSRFAELTNATAYLLARVPGDLCDFICAELESQNVPFNIQGNETHKDGLIVRWDGSVFECQTAYAEFD